MSDELIEDRIERWFRELCREETEKPSVLLRDAMDELRSLRRCSNLEDSAAKASEVLDRIEAQSKAVQKQNDKYDNDLEHSQKLAAAWKAAAEALFEFRGKEKPHPTQGVAMAMYTEAAINSHDLYIEAEEIEADTPAGEPEDEDEPCPT